MEVVIGRKHVYGKMLINSKQKLLNFVSSGTIIDFNRNLDNVEYTKHLIIVKEDRQIKNYYIIVIVVLYQFFFLFLWFWCVLSISLTQFYFRSSVKPTTFYSTKRFFQLHFCFCCWCIFYFNLGSINLEHNNIVGATFQCDFKKSLYLSSVINDSSSSVWLNFTLNNHPLS